MVKIRLENLSKHFGKVKAVDDLNLEIKKGEFLSLLGPSGCGKTTTLRLIAGLETPTSGEIYFDDVPSTKVSPSERNVAMVFQSYAIYPHMTTFENISFPLEVRKVPKNERIKKVKEVATFLEIEDLLNRKSAQLSGGQRQRVALARAIVRQPSVFLMDEPLSNLDAKLRIHMRTELKKMQEKLGITTIYVTHDQVEAMTMSMRVAVLNKGVLQQVDIPNQLYLRPKNMWVAGFVGSPPMNLVDCTLTEKKGKIFLDAGEFNIRIKDDIANLIMRKAVAPDMTLGVRPDDLCVNKKVQHNSIGGEVYALEPMGDSVTVDVAVGKNLIKVRTPPSFTISTGSKIYLTFDEKKMYLYDRKGDLLT